MRQQILRGLLRLRHHFIVIGLYLFFREKFQRVERERRQIFRADIVSDDFKRNQRFGQRVASFARVRIVLRRRAVRYGQTQFAAVERGGGRTECPAVREYAVKPLFQQRRAGKLIHGKLQNHAAVRFNQGLLSRHVDFAVGIGGIKFVYGVAALLRGEGACPSAVYGGAGNIGMDNDDKGLFHADTFKFIYLIL